MKNKFLDNFCDEYTLSDEYSKKIDKIINETLAKDIEGTYLENLLKETNEV